MHLRELRAAGKAAAAPPMPRSHEDEKVRKPQDDTSGADAVSISTPVPPEEKPVIPVAPAPVQLEPEKEAVAFAVEAAGEEPVIPLRVEPEKKTVPVSERSAFTPLPPAEPGFETRAEEARLRASGTGSRSERSSARRTSRPNMRWRPPGWFAAEFWRCWPVLLFFCVMPMPGI